MLQVIAGVTLAGLAEGMALADRAGLQQRDVLEIMELTTMASPMLMEKGKGKYILLLLYSFHSINAVLVRFILLSYSSDITFCTNNIGYFNSAYLKVVNSIFLTIYHFQTLLNFAMLFTREVMHYCTIKCTNLKLHSCTGNSIISMFGTCSV